MELARVNKSATVSNILGQIIRVIVENVVLNYRSRWCLIVDARTIIYYHVKLMLHRRLLILHV